MRDKSVLLFQAQCCVKILKGETVLPSKSEMYDELTKDLEERLKSTGRMRCYHRLHQAAQPYFDSLSDLANIPKTPRIIFEIYFTGLDYMLKDLHNFRKRIYHILDKEEYSITMRN